MTAWVSTPSNAQALQRKRWWYLIGFLPAILPWLGSYFSHVFGQSVLWSFFTPFIVFGVIPLADYAFGKDAVNPDDEQTKSLSELSYYRWLTLLCLPIQLVSVVAGLWVFNHIESSIEKIGWIISIGVVSSALAINVAHELIHKNSKLEQWVGGVLLASVCYGGFKIEHVRGHHVHVSTPEDASSARYGQTVFGFIPRAVFMNIKNAFALESKRLAVKGQSAWSVHNELLVWYGLSLLMAVAAWLAFGFDGLVFFVAQGVVAFCLLETVNYIEHYGLHRRKTDEGRYERVTHQHSWNSSYWLSNLLLFHLQRHSDHHAFPKRRYQVLRHYEDSPQLPGGYMAMIVLAWVPVLWFRWINPRVQAYYNGVPEELVRHKS